MNPLAQKKEGLPTVIVYYISFPWQINNNGRALRANAKHILVLKFIIKDQGYDGHLKTESILKKKYYTNYKSSSESHCNFKQRVLLSYTSILQSMSSFYLDQRSRAASEPKWPGRRKRFSTNRISKRRVPLGSLTFPRTRQST